MASQARSPEQIAADIATTRDRLAGTIDQLAYRTNPKTVANRQVASIKARFVDPNGKPKVDAIAKAAGIVVGVVAAIVLLRKVVG